MSDKSAPPEAALPTTKRDVGALLIATLLLSLFAVIGSFAWPYVFPPRALTNEQGAAVETVSFVALLFGSAVAFVLATIAAGQLLLGHLNRSWKSLLLMTAAALTALPGLYICWLFLTSLLPLTASELRAIDIAEGFIERNGYTSTGHPKDLPVLQNDIMDPLEGSIEGLLETRIGTLQPKALVVNSAGPGILVFFESIPPQNGGTYRAVEVNEGNARIVHQDMYPGLFAKRITR